MNIPKTMHAVLLTGHGGFDRLHYSTDVPVPVADAGEVLVRVGAAAMNNADINTRIAWYARAVTEAVSATNTDETSAEGGTWSRTPNVFPRIQGADVCGRIVAVGEAVDPGRIAERVIIDPVLRVPVGFRPYEMVYFGGNCDGGFAQYAKVPTANAVRIESSLSDVELASFPCAYGTAENMLTRVGLSAGETIVVTGASGGVGSALIQLALWRGAEVIAVASAHKKQPLLRLGAARVVDRGGDLVEILGRESVDVCADLVGGEKFGQLFEVLRRGGRLVQSGAIAGPKVTLDLRTIYLKDIRYFGATVMAPKVFPNLVRAIERGAVMPLVSKSYPLKDIVQAQQDFLAKQHTGKLVLIPPE